VEKAQQIVDVEESKKLEKKLRNNQFSLQDFLDQLRQIQKMGSLKDLMSMIPGIGNKLAGVDLDTNQLKYIEAIICSMTMEEREKPQILNGSRRKRIANGSGRTVADVNRLLKQFEDMRNMMKQINKMSGKKGGMKGMHGMKGKMPF